MNSVQTMLAWDVACTCLPIYTPATHVTKHAAVRFSTGAGLDFGGTHNICAPMEAFRVGVEKVKDNCNYYWAGSVGIRCLEVGTKRVTRSTTRRAPIRMVPHRVPQPTHVFTFWEGIPVAAKQHLAYLVSNTPSIKSIFIVQRGVDIVQDMAGLGFKRLVLVHQLAMTTCGAGESFKGYIFEVLPPCKGGKDKLGTCRVLGDCACTPWGHTAHFQFGVCVVHSNQ